MSDEFVKRNDCLNTAQRIHERIDAGHKFLQDKLSEMQQCQAGMDVNVKIMKENSDKMFKVMYGNGQDGIITKVANAEAKSKSNFRLIVLILTAIIGIAVMITVVDGIKKWFENKPIAYVVPPNLKVVGPVDVSP